MILNDSPARDMAALARQADMPQHQVEQMRTSDGQTLLAADVDALVDAMAGFAAPALGQTTLSTSLRTTLQPVIAAAWN